MSAAAFDPAQLATARAIHELSGQLAGELDAGANPQRLALRHLGVDAMGWTRVPYHAESFRIWGDMLRRQPDDIETLHHLAIMHHARAFDLEAGDDPARSDADWELALKYWHRLWRLDGFWDGIAEITCKGVDRRPVDELRDEFPALLLQVHYDVAFDARTPNHRAKYHIGLAVASPFDRKYLEEVRTAAYRRCSERVPTEVWQMDMLDPDVIEREGCSVVLSYLERDPGCRAALEDAMRFQYRLLRAWSTDLRAAGDDASRRREVLHTIEAAAAKWRPYFDQLVPVARHLDDDIRSKTCVWYRFNGDVLFELYEIETAIGLFEQGAKVAAEDDEERKRCIKTAGEACAFEAREKTSKRADGAKAYCDRVRARGELSPRACCWLADAYGNLNEYAAAEEICAEALARGVDQTETNPDVIAAQMKDMEVLRESRSRFAEARGRSPVDDLRKQAKELIKTNEHEKAIGLLRQARKAGGDTKELREELSLALTEAAMFGALGQERAQQMLYEATLLDRSNRKASDGLQALQRLGQFGH